MRAPCCAKARAMARPIPRPPPVISAIFPFSILVARKPGIALFEKCVNAFMAVIRFETTHLGFSLVTRSEERRVGKECRCRGTLEHEKKNGRRTRRER